MCSRRVIVLKFGGSVLRDETTLRGAVHEIYRWRRAGWRVVAVVSALGGTTDALLRRCDAVSERPAPHARAAVVAGGELECAAWLGVLLDRAGVPASVLTPAGIGLTARGPALDAIPDRLDAETIRDALARDGVAVVPGYVAQDDAGRTVVLGRGGSDLSALFLAHRLGADRCRLVKDVDGLYEGDPAGAGPPPRRYEHATWQDALATDGSIVQHKAVRFARAHGIVFEIGRLQGVRPTRVGAERTVFAAPEPRRAMRVAVLGAGVVGGGVIDLLSRVDGVDIAAVSVRDAQRTRDVALPPGARVLDAVAAASCGVDVVVEAIGGVETALAAARAALRGGAHFVTANKSLIAAHGAELETLAARAGRRVLVSASVAGSVPVLERLRDAEAGSIRSVEGILNGTTNFTLDRVREGTPFAEAVTLAQRRGFAEADPSRDLDGRDAAEKLCVVAWVLGAPAIEPRHVERDVLDGRLESMGARGAVIRHVARLTVNGSTSAAVRLETLSPHHALAATCDEENTVIIESTNGATVQLRGRGAGRWPTAESVVGDVLELLRSKRPRPDTVRVVGDPLPPDHHPADPRLQPPGRSRGEPMNARGR